MRLSDDTKTLITALGLGIAIMLVVSAVMMLL